MTDVVITSSPAPGLRQLDDLARELTGWGWRVRFESHSFATGAPGGHLVLTRPLASAAEYVVARPRRHEVHVWVRSGDEIWPLGTVVDVDEVHDLLRRWIRTAGSRPRPRTAGE
jgi:hypothetical protein